MSARVLDFFVRSTFLSLVITSLPIVLLLVLWDLRLTTPTIMVAWTMFTLIWTFYVLLGLSRRLTG